MDWRGAVMENWPYKLMALFLGLLLWVNVSVEERVEQEVPVRMEWEVRDTSVVLVDAPDQVGALVQGRGGDVIDMGTSGPSIRYVVDSATAGTRTVRLRPDMVSKPQSANVQVISVRPSEIRLRFEQRTARRVPVRPNLEAEAAENFAVVAGPVVEPDSVVIRGPRSEVDSVGIVTTESRSLAGLRRTRRVDLRVQLPEGVAHVDVSPGIVLATVEVDSVVERTFRLRVRRSAPIPADLVPRPDSVTVTVRGPARHLQQLVASSLRAELTAPETVEDGVLAAVRVVLPESLVARESVSARSDPAEILLVAPGGGA